jgi:glycosyltransferase involved in cell wall biosynthesis
MKKIKILYISHSPYLNGAEICLFNLVKSIDRERYEPVVIFPEVGPLTEKLKETGIKTYVAPLERWVGLEGKRSYSGISLADRVSLLMQIIEKESPDVIHTNTSVVFEGAIAAKLRNLPHIWHIHEVLRGHPTLDPYLPLPSLYWVIDKLADRVVVVSNDMRNELRLFMTDDKIETVFNGIEISKHGENDNISLRQELGIPDDYYIAINVASILKYKGQDNLLDAAALVKASGGKVKYLLVGSGSKDNVSHLLEKVAKLGLGEDVQYLGYRQDIPRLIKGSDFFVLPSVKEGFPLVVLEAMALRKPIVATNCCGPADMIDDGVNGFLVPVNRPDLLSEKIMEMTRDKAATAGMGERSYSKFQENFTIEKYAQGFERIYSRLSGSHKPNAVLTDYDRSLLESLVEIYQSYMVTNKSNSELLAQVVAHDKLLGERDRQIAERNKLLGDRERQISERNQWLADRDHQISERNQWLADRDRQIAERNHWLADRDRQLSERNQLLVDRDRQIEQLNQTLSAREATIQQFARSLSWRMTAPLRWLFESIVSRNRR